MRITVESRLAAARSFAMRAGVVVALLGLLVLAGWIFDVARLKSVVPGLGSMKANTAVACVLLGAALSAVCSKVARVRALGRASAVAAVVLGAVTVSQDLLGWNLRIDELFFQDPSPSRGRMSVATASGLILTGSALALLDAGKGRAAQALSVAVLLAAMPALVGYLYSTPSLYSAGRYRSIALHSAMALAILGAGSLSARPERGIVGSFLGDDAGAQTARRLLPAALFVPLVIGWVEVLSVRRGWLDATLASGISAVMAIAILVAIIEAHAVIAREADERRRQAEEQSAAFVAMLDQSGEAIFAWELGGAIIYWNHGAERLYGYSKRDAVGAVAHSLLATRPEGPLLRDSLTRDSEWTGDLEHTTHDGRRIVVECVMKLVRGPGGRRVVLETTRDVTERKRVERDREHVLEAERAARAALEQSLRIKNEFLSVVSHELRTPLTAILGFSQLLQRRAEAAPLKGQLAAIERNARHQITIVDDLLDMSRIDTGKTRLEVRTVRPHEIVAAALETVQPTADAKGIVVSRRIDAPDATVLGDADRLQQIVWNLLSNAVKFTPKGGRIEVSLRRAGAHVEIRIRDTGQGISPEMLPVVFDRFRQADASKTRRHGGLGLGLAIVKELVELHGGTVTAESEGEGQGATFVVTFPEGAAAEVPEALPDGADHANGAPDPTSSPVSLRTLRGVKVLVVDDDDDTRQVVGELLAEREAEVVSVCSAPEAMALLERSRPDVVVSDIGMPDVDGYALMRHILASTPDGGRPRAVALTAYGRKEDQERALSEGFHAYLSKPVEPWRLIATVAELAAKGAPT